MPAISDMTFMSLATPELRQEFWRRVKYAVEQIYNGDPAVVDAYRRQVDDATAAEQMLVYREEPLQVASDLVHLARQQAEDAPPASGLEEITDEQLERYQKAFDKPLSFVPEPLLRQ